MSYDLLVFKPGVPPDDRVGFISWFAQVVRLRDGHLRADPSGTDPRLIGWQRDMERMFPCSPIRFGRTPDTEDEIIGADYRFGPDVVFARLDWRLSRKAQAHGLKLARTHSIGFFDAGAERAPVWTVTPAGAFQMAHREEAAQRDPRSRLRA
jgi:hypothetical protein